MSCRAKRPDILMIVPCVGVYTYVWHRYMWLHPNSVTFTQAISIFVWTHKLSYNFIIHAHFFFWKITIIPFQCADKFVHTDCNRYPKSMFKCRSECGKWCRLAFEKVRFYGAWSKTGMWPIKVNQEVIIGLMLILFCWQMQLWSFPLTIFW